MKKLLLLITLMTLSPVVLAVDIDIDSKAAAVDAFISVAKGSILAAVLFYILSFGLWGKARNTAVEYGRWIGAICSAIVLGGVVSKPPHFYPSQADFYYVAVVNIIGWFVIGFVVGYAWRKFKLIKSISSSIKSISSMGTTNNIADKYWEEASTEFASSRHEATWAKSFAMTDGDEAKAKAMYIKNRAHDLMRIDNDAIAQPLSAKDSPKITLLESELSLLGGSFSTIRKLVLAILGIIALGVYLLKGGSVSPSSNLTTPASVSIDTLPDNLVTQDEAKTMIYDVEANRRIYKVLGPDNHTYSFEGPADATQEEKINFAIGLYDARHAKLAEPKTGGVGKK